MSWLRSKDVPFIECDFCETRVRLVNGDIAGQLLPEGWVSEYADRATGFSAKTFCSHEHARRWSLRQHRAFVSKLRIGTGDLLYPEIAATYRSPAALGEDGDR